MAAKHEMSRDREYGDEVFLQIFANLYNKNIIIIPVAIEHSVIQEFGYTIVKANVEKASSFPVFLAYFSEAKFGGNSHYQSIIPVKDNPILQHVVKNGGFDVSKKQGWTDDSQVNETEDITMNYETNTNGFSESAKIDAYNIENIGWSVNITPPTPTEFTLNIVPPTPTKFSFSVIPPMPAKDNDEYSFNMTTQFKPKDLF